MNGWLYLIRNGDLYKIGVTRNFDNRMRQLKPDNVVAKLYSSEFRQLERELHRRYKSVRIPQTEYFRLDNRQIREIKRRISEFYYPRRFTIDILINTICLLKILFFLIIILLSFTISDTNNVLLITFKSME